MPIRNLRSLGSIGALSGALLLQPACASDDAAHGSTRLVNRTTQALLSGDLLSVNGTYAGCSHRADGWSLEIAAMATLDHPELSVLLKDVDCVLTMTELNTTAGLIVADPPIVLDASYELTASSFVDPVEFYANAQLDSVAFATDFVLTIIYSDDSNFAVDDNTAGFAVVESSVTAESIPAPDYGLDVAGLDLLTDVDDVVDSVTGTASLSLGLDMVTGQNFVVVDASGLVTYAAIDAAYLAGAITALPALSIAAAAFSSLVGDVLTTPQTRTLIIANVVEGVASYQVFEITFNGAL
jgi:hypothetical protein